MSSTIATPWDWAQYQADHHEHARHCFRNKGSWNPEKLAQLTQINLDHDLPLPWLQPPNQKHQYLSKANYRRKRPISLAKLNLP